MKGRDDEFFIGWAGAAPSRTAAFLRRVVAGLLVLSLAVATAVTLAHGPAAPSRFEFGVERTFEGRLQHVPYPTLLVDRPGGGVSRWLVTVFGKRGAEPVTAPLDGHRVRLAGSLVHRGGRTMVELAEGSLEDLGPAAAEPLPPWDEAVTLRGEIVDSKCYLGVMKPGNLKTHRACAVRCISGGVPPVLLVREGAGARYVLLAGPDGQPFGAELLEHVAEPVELTGRLRSLGGYEVMAVDPGSLRRR